MENNFVPYALALALNKLGCKLFINYVFQDEQEPYPTIEKGILWQQAFDWFRVEKDLYADIYRTGKLFSANIEDMLMGNSLCEVVKEVTYEEARLECLKKLIEIVI